jgi:L-threonylcarbamoyladenylate synthase
METQIIKLDAYEFNMDELKCAAEILKSGGLVAFPTETVYGLGANALDEKAVNGIFSAKGRPSDNPLIIHISKIDDLYRLTSAVSKTALQLIDAFWPGPLTLVMPKSTIIPAVITAGLDTVAIRMPAHPIALALINISGVPVAAPSANTSGKPSPTMASHVIEDLSGKIDLIIDGGNADVGVESTVVDVTSFPPTILRPGGITLSQISRVCGDALLDPALSKQTSNEYKPKSPGMKYRHYSPNAKVFIVEGKLDNVCDKINIMAAELVVSGQKVGILATDQTAHIYNNILSDTSNIKVLSVGDRTKPDSIASQLFHLLREFDKLGVEIILAEAVDDEGIGLAVMNRLNKAAGYNIIKV